MLILLAGDCHGDFDNVVDTMQYAKSKSCSIVMFLGDFGIFPNIELPGFFSDEKLDDINEVSIGYSIDIHFIRGNHEDQDYLRKMAPDNTTTKIRDHIIYHPNTDVFEFDNVKFLAMGGAWSKDYKRRTPGFTWFPSEEISEADIRFPFPHVDIVLSHDAPITANIDDMMDFVLLPEAQSNRFKLQHVIEVVKPKAVFHGHYHHRCKGTCNYSFDESYKVIPCIGLDANVPKSLAQYYVLDTSLYL